MSIVQTIQCDICGKQQAGIPEEGWPGWGALQGIVLDGVANPNLCPKHLAMTADFVNNMKQDLGGDE